MLKKIVIILSLLMLFVSSAWPIDKVTSDDKDRPSQKETNKGGDSELKASISDPAPQTVTPQDSKDYNDFVDRNNNGINDRMESKPQQTQNPQPDTNDEKPTSSDTTELGQ